MAQFWPPSSPRDMPTSRVIYTSDTHFVAKYPGWCARCGERFPEGADIYYNDEDELVSLSCCAEPMDHGSETQGSDLDLKTMPRGKTVRDTCPRCFLIHTPAQGDQCE